MTKRVLRRLSLVGLGLVLTTGLLAGCGGDETDPASPQRPQQQVEKGSEKDPDPAESEHEEEGDHDEEGPEHGHEHGPDHFEGKKAETYEEAVSNMKEANGRLEDLLADGEVTGEEFYKIHRMSYTMENALAKIREESDGNYEDVAGSLEAVHLASEKRDPETVLREGRNYLEGARAMLEEE